MYGTIIRIHTNTPIIIIYHNDLLTSEFTDGTGDWLTFSLRATNGEVGTEFDGVINLVVGEEDCFFKSDWFFLGANDGDGCATIAGSGFCWVVD